ncbi:MAG: UDP-N-acetylmuramoyl-L-alanyl-D-glutamate--2,6-diaminopimelate ligase, partial [Duncaniella sp.]|nr:UDP-N-acetylmuramoyl-L-alanyl-D-glutamate--2,6-diaminopimelate ligase [Duncaniella sp.]
MLLNHLLSILDTEATIGSDLKEITSVTADSRRVQEGTLFVAVPGVSVDGHDFIGNAVAAGATAVVCERLPERLESMVTYIKVASSAVALGYIASQWWDNPSRKLHLVGVTGTNGKTTTATLIYEMARLAGHKAGLLSTVCNYVEDTPYPPAPPTPGPKTLNEMRPPRGGG